MKYKFSKHNYGIIFNKILTLIIYMWNRLSVSGYKKLEINGVSEFSFSLPIKIYINPKLDKINKEISLIIDFLPINISANKN